MRIGVFGGTFNPIHTAHLLLAETAREALKLDRILFIPTHHPPHKHGRGILPGPVRFKLVQLAIQDHPTFAASDIELQRAGPSYSIDTVRVLRERLPQAKLFLLIGEDMLLIRWAAWEEMKRLCTVVVARRPLRRLQTSVGKRGRRANRGLKWLAMPQLDITSSDIRLRLKGGRSIRYLVPTPVERYIRERQLYGGHA
jgi:nicotinate-nucleotide adenylyltransferase